MLKLTGSTGKKRVTVFGDTLEKLKKKLRGEELTDVVVFDTDKKEKGQSAPTLKELFAKGAKNGDNN